MLELDPDNAIALNNLAVTGEQRKDPRALQRAKRAYELAPQNAAIQDTYGWLLVQRGEVDRGLELLRSAARAMPGSPDVQFHYGAALARKGLDAEAGPVLEQVVRSGASEELKTAARRELAALGD